jgi:hypothetical protein
MSRQSERLFVCCEVNHKPIHWLVLWCCTIANGGRRGENPLRRSEARPARKFWRINALAQREFPDMASIRAERWRRN